MNKSFAGGQVRMLVSAFTVAFAWTVQAATFIGGADNKWSNADNWENKAKPQSGDSVEIPNTVGALTCEIDEAFTIGVLTVNATGAVTFSGSGSLSLAKVDVHAPTTFSSGLSVDFSASSSYVYAGKASGETDFPLEFNGPVTLTGVNNFFMAGKSKITFNSTLTGAGATVRPDTGVAWSSNGVVTFNDAVTVKTVYFGNHNSVSTFHFNGTGNSWEKLQLGYGVAEFFASGAIPVTSVLSWTTWSREQTAVSAGSYAFHGNDITADRLEGVCNGSYVDGHNIASGEVWTPGAQAATLTLNGTANAETDARLTGKLSLVWNPTGDFTQTLTKRVHTTSGSVTVKAGTLKLTEGATMGSASALVVENGTMALDGAGAGAFAGALSVTLGATGKIALTAGTPDPFSASKTDLLLTTGGVLEIPEGTTCSFKSVTIDGKLIPLGDYVQGDDCKWIVGGGKVSVLTGAAAEPATWTGRGADEKTTTADNWDIGVPLAGAALTFAKGGTRALLAKDLIVSGLTFKPTTDRQFAVINDTSSPDAKILLGADGIRFDGDGQTNVIASPIVLKTEANTWNFTGAGNKLTISGPVTSTQSNVALVLTGNGGTMDVDGTIDISGTVTFKQGTFNLTGELFGTGITKAFFKNQDASAKGFYYFKGGVYDVPMQFDQGNYDPGSGGMVLLADSVSVFKETVTINPNWYDMRITPYDHSKTTFENGIVCGPSKLQLWSNGGNSEIVVTNVPVSGSATGGILVFGWGVNTVTFAAPDNHVASGKLEISGPSTLRTTCDWALSTNTVVMPLLFGVEYDMKGSKLDLCGHDQAVGELLGGSNLDATASVVSDAPATLYVVQNGATTSTTFTPTFKGAASLCKSGTNELVLAGVSTTTGRLEVAAGRLSFSGAGSWTKAASVAVSGGELVVDAATRLPRRAQSYVLTGGKLNIASDVALRAKRVLVSDGADGLTELPPGVYTAANLPQLISGSGSLTATGGGMMFILR